MNKPQSFSELIATWSQELTSWVAQAFAPVVDAIITGMDAYVDSRARAIVEQVLSEHYAQLAEFESNWLDEEAKLERER